MQELADALTRLAVQLQRYYRANAAVPDGAVEALRELREALRG